MPLKMYNTLKEKDLNHNQESNSEPLAHPNTWIRFTCLPQIQELRIWFPAVKIKMFSFQTYVY